MFKKKKKTFLLPNHQLVMNASIKGTCSRSAVFSFSFWMRFDDCAATVGHSAWSPLEGERWIESWLGQFGFKDLNKTDNKHTCKQKSKKIPSIVIWMISLVKTVW